MTASAIGGAIEALLGLLTASADSVDLDASKVVDGFPRFSIVDTDFIAIGGLPAPTASGSQELLDGLRVGPVGGRRRETFTLSVTCSSSKGGDDQAAVRARAFELAEFVDEVINADTTLGGAVRVAQVAGDIDLNQTSADTAKQGVYADVGLSVVVEALI
jgi:hypothetical protein